MTGRAERRLIVFVPVPGIAKLIASGPGFELASRMAWRKDPAPESLVLVTLNVIDGLDKTTVGALALVLSTTRSFSASLLRRIPTSAVGSDSKSIAPAIWSCHDALPLLELSSGDIAEALIIRCN
jgi:hypothetical protein